MAKIALYNSKAYETPLFKAMVQAHHFTFIPEALSLTTLEKAKGCDAISCFVTDCLNQEVMYALARQGISLIALRCSGFDHVDLTAANDAGITVVHVPSYSPEAVAEFAVTLILTLNRNIITSYQQSLTNNFLLDNLVGFNVHQKTVGIIGTGQIGTAFAKIMHGFGCRLLAVDPIQNPQCAPLNVTYVSFDELLQESDIISLHCPLNDETRHLIDANACAKIKKNAMLINTGRGALCDTRALIHALESGDLGYAGLDVYEHENDLFFKDHTGETIQDTLFLKLRSLPRVLITPHQAFLTQEALVNIVKTTLDNITAFELGHPINQIC